MLLDELYQETQQFIEQMPKEKRKQYGQFFTTVHTAEFMASLFSVDMSKSALTILDAGAGSGILSAALVCNLRGRGYAGIIELTCYETDENILPILCQNLAILKEKEHISYIVLNDNYITSQAMDNQSLFASQIIQYDLVIGNPPYKKLPKDAPEALHLPEVCYGSPNLYFLFCTMSIYNLKDNGELVYIIPRSWTSGAYFECFRNFLYKNTIIEHIHLFGSRDTIFKDESVLQETIIIKLRKTTQKPPTITVSFSETSDFLNVRSNKIAYDTIVGSNGYIYLVTSLEEANTLSRVNQLHSTLVRENFKMKTGIIVDFRTQEVLRNMAGENTYPLFYSQHIKDGKVIWPIGRENEYICTERGGFLQENANYVFVKRFTSKEEKRRLQCGIYLAKQYKDYKYISTQNKLNFIRCNNEDEAYGLYVLLNSTLYDLYYRILNGSTQVNSTEMNNIPIPDREVIVKMGKELKGKELSEQNCNTIINRWIN